MTRNKKAWKGNKKFKYQKVPSYDLITGQILKELLIKIQKKLLHLINASFKFKYVPRQWKLAEAIMISKSNKDISPSTLFYTCAWLISMIFIANLFTLMYYTHLFIISSFPNFFIYFQYIGIITSYNKFYNILVIYFITTRN